MSQPIKVVVDVVVHVNIVVVVFIVVVVGMAVGDARNLPLMFGNKTWSSVSNSSFK